MKAVCIDDSLLVLDVYKTQMKQMKELEDIQYFEDPLTLLEYSSANDFDIAFVDIHMPIMNGIELAKNIKEQKPDCDIIFITSEAEYKELALQEKCSGYLIKPISVEEVEILLKNIVNRAQESKRMRMRVQCFGNFEVFVDGTPVKFQRKKTKEVFAYLVDRRGARSSVREICAVVWEDNNNEENSQAYLRKCISDMKNTFAAQGVEGVLISEHGAYSVNPEAFECDYYDFVKGDSTAVAAYNNEYMMQYSWSEYMRASLNG